MVKFRFDVKSVLQDSNGECCLIKISKNIDILEKEEINTYREKDHDYLMAIRNGYYMNEDGTIKPELYKELDLLKSKMKDLEKTTKLPEKPYYKDVENLLIKLNKISLNIAECKKTEIGFLHKYGK